MHRCRECRPDGQRLEVSTAGPCLAFEELHGFPVISQLRGWLRTNRDEFIPELFCLPLEFGLQAFLTFGVPCGP